MQAQCSMGRWGSEARSSQLFLIICNIGILSLFSTCGCTGHVKFTLVDTTLSRGNDLSKASPNDDFNNKRTVANEELGLQVFKVLHGGDFCYHCVPGQEHPFDGSNPRWLASRRLLVSRKVNMRTGENQECSALIILVALLGVACLGFFILLCVEKQGRTVITNETIKQKSVRATLRASLPEEVSFRTLRKITNNFNHILGDGGFGLVYDGEFNDGSKVAVKVLDRSMNQGEREFRAEVFMMATTQHMNVMRLRGFCSEGTHRILVYDFMPNSSLDKWIFRPSGKHGRLDWSVRFSIAVGAARGLTYLHEECSQPIIHLDVKPENILLDEDFTPKLADFGLSRLISRNQSRIMTKTRGTPGYLAPEWVQRSFITTKVDVYSFGMVLLELVCGREVINMGLGAEQWYLPAWVIRMVEEGRTIDIVDKLILEEVHYFFEDQVKRTIEVALCCIQEDPTLRPKMSRAVQMLEGVVEPKSPLPIKRIVTNPTSTKLKAKMSAYMDAIAEGISDISLESSERSSQASSGQKSGQLLSSTHTQ